MKRIVVGISGSSAPWLGIRLLEVLSGVSDLEIHLVMSNAVKETLAYEAPEWTLEKVQKLAHRTYSIKDISAPIASGSFPIEGMVVMPCSMRTLGAIAHGMGDNLLTRAADVTLKERRSLILVPRETPLHLVHLRNMVAVTEMGGIILPPILAFYHQPQAIQDIVDHVVGKVLDLLKIPHQLFRRWKADE